MDIAAKLMYSLIRHENPQKEHASAEELIRRAEILVRWYESKKSLYLANQIVQLLEEIGRKVNETKSSRDCKDFQRLGRRWQQLSMKSSSLTIN